ncbi:hypothetical protein P255_00567 [Acinetobacter brisouii CIP 110357]|uniref:Uncharacterized protein n=1 Tax=Acinetobacter brisouii CIP 110357 TaxID=1341683 RepID=V2UUY0_9GAMM|nr:hypothetical protein F954_02407 [Acinetobacter brisouii ANC 4119]ESK52416.1 hypothetical protein P255_00567 [Acinetobacter brisouii CIP 110357]
MFRACEILFMRGIIGQMTHLSISQFSHSYFKILKHLVPQSRRKHLSVKHP